MHIITTLDTHTHTHRLGPLSIAAAAASGQRVDEADKRAHFLVYDKYTLADDGRSLHVDVGDDADDVSPPPPPSLASNSYDKVLSTTIKVGAFDDDDIDVAEGDVVYSGTCGTGMGGV